MSGLIRILFAGLSEYVDDGPPLLTPVLPPEPAAAFACDDVRLVCVKIAGFNAWVNQDFVLTFQRLADYIRLANIATRIERVDSFCCRLMRWSSNWSYHSYGQAIDFNPDLFPAKEAAVGDPARYEIPAWYRSLVDYAKGLGFVWGGDWQAYYDPMHLQIGVRWPRNS